MRAIWRWPFWRGAVPGLLCGLAVWLLAKAPVMHGLEDWMLDSRFHLRGQRPSAANVVIIGLDERALDEVGKSHRDGVGDAVHATEPGAGALLGLAMMVGWCLLCQAVFHLDWRVPMVAPLLLTMVASTAAFSLRWRKLRRMMGVIKSEAIAKALEADPQKLDRRGEERVVTVLFADIRGFTSFSEGHTPREVVALLNAYFSAIVPVIEAEAGTLNQYMGDGIMVIFGARGRIRIVRCERCGRRWAW